MLVHDPIIKIGTNVTGDVDDESHPDTKFRPTRQINQFVYFGIYFTPYNIECQVNKRILINVKS